MDHVARVQNLSRSLANVRLVRMNLVAAQAKLSARPAAKDVDISRELTTLDLVERELVDILKWAQKTP